MKWFARSQDHIRDTLIYSYTYKRMCKLFASCATMPMFRLIRLYIPYWVTDILCMSWLKLWKDCVCRLGIWNLLCEDIYDRISYYYWNYNFMNTEKVKFVILTGGTPDISNYNGLQKYYYWQTQAWKYMYERRQVVGVILTRYMFTTTCQNILPNFIPKTGV